MTGEFYACCVSIDPGAHHADAWANPTRPSPRTAHAQQRHPAALAFGPTLRCSSVCRQGEPATSRAVIGDELRAQSSRPTRPDRPVGRKRSRPLPACTRNVESAPHGRLPGTWRGLWAIARQTQSSHERPSEIFLAMCAAAGGDSARPAAGCSAASGRRWSAPLCLIEVPFEFAQPLRRSRRSRRFPHALVGAGPVCHEGRGVKARRRTVVLPTSTPRSEGRVRLGMVCLPACERGEPLPRSKRRGRTETVPRDDSACSRRALRP